MITIHEEPKGEDYRRLIQHCANYSTFGMLMLRDEFGLRPSGERLLQAIDPHLVERRTVSSWPGTVLLGGASAQRIVFELNAISLGLLTASASRLYEWVSPALPEDLCLLRADESPVLVSISHERDGFVEGDEEFEATFMDVFAMASFRVTRS